MANDTIEILIISGSRLLVDGLRKIMESEAAIRVIADLSEIEELKKFMKSQEPDYIFFDQRVGSPDIEKYLLSKKVKLMNTQVILLSDDDVADDSPESFITVNQNTSAVELLDIIKNRRELQNGLVKKSAFIVDSGINVTKAESKVIDLITSGHSNKEIAQKLRVSEKTIKAHVTSIFTKLNIQNRYQLMVYGQRNSKDLS